MDYYKSQHPLETRKAECERISIKHPDRVPIIVCKDRHCKLDEIDKAKYLVPKDMSLGQFVFIIRKRIKLSPEKALFVIVNKRLRSSQMNLEEIYGKDKDPEDGFLYITYSTENTFG